VRFLGHSFVIRPSAVQPAGFGLLPRCYMLFAHLWRFGGLSATMLLSVAGCSYSRPLSLTLDHQRSTGPADALVADRDGETPEAPPFPLDETMVAQELEEMEVGFLSSEELQVVTATEASPLIRDDDALATADWERLVGPTNDEWSDAPPVVVDELDAAVLTPQAVTWRLNLEEIIESAQSNHPAVAAAQRAVRRARAALGTAGWRPIRDGY